MPDGKTQTRANARVCGLILCAGKGTRTRLGYNKLLYLIGKQTVLEMTVERFAASRVNALYAVIDPADEAAVRKLLRPYPSVALLYGGETRTDSVRMGLKGIGPCDAVVIHDGARPYVTAETINRSVESALEFGSGIAAVPAVDTVKEADGNDFVRTLPRAGLYRVQTPQAFRYDEIADAYARVEGSYGDDSEVYERAGYRAKLVAGDYDNVKVTGIADLYRGAAHRTKIGVGFDVHRLESGLPLVLGGVRVPHDKGLKGHSDADVLTHAVMDALLSAAGMPDIGVLFPDCDPQYKGINSLTLLGRVGARVAEAGFCVGNVSAAVIAEKPKLRDFIPQMRGRIGETLGIGADRINVSATTAEGLGAIGNEEGIAATASCLLYY